MGDQLTGILFLDSHEKEWCLHTKRTKFLPTLVGISPFYMDVLAIDQEDETARISVVQHIPDVYRKAQKTIVIREDGGFGDCCAGLLDVLDQLEAETHLGPRGSDGHFVGSHLL